MKEYEGGKERDVCTLHREQPGHLLLLLFDNQCTLASLLGFFFYLLFLRRRWHGPWRFIWGASIGIGLLGSPWCGWLSTPSSRRRGRESASDGCDWCCARLLWLLFLRLRG